MSRNGSGTWSAPSNSWNPAVSGATVDPTDWASFLADLTTAMSASIANDGQTTTTQRIPFAAGIQTDTITEKTAATGVTADGALLKDGGVDISGALAASGNIIFPATQVASAGANTLDDYEEGTWTPAVNFGGAHTGVTYTTDVGTYTKIGNRVLFTCSVTLSNKGSSTGSLTIDGLPFTSKNTTGHESAGGVYSTSIDAAIVAPLWFLGANNTGFLIRYISAGTVTSLTETNCNNTSAFIFSGSYETA